jgi:hypothetical protein
LKPNDLCKCLTVPLNSKSCILYIYSTNRGTEYLKQGIYSPFFSSSKCSLFHNSNVFGSCIIHILYTECAKIKKNNSDAKRLMVGEVEAGGFRNKQFFLCFILLLLHIHESMYFIYHRYYTFLSIGSVFNKANSLSLYASHDIIPLTQMKEIHLIVFLRFVRLNKLGYIYRTMEEVCHCNLF